MKIERYPSYVLVHEHGDICILADLRLPNQGNMNFTIYICPGRLPKLSKLQENCQNNELGDEIRAFKGRELQRLH